MAFLNFLVIIFGLAMFACFFAHLIWPGVACGVVACLLNLKCKELYGED